MTHNPNFSFDPGAASGESSERHRPNGQKANGAGSNGATPRFHLVPFAEIKVGPERPYLVKNIIPREGLVVVWGAPKCGKSFWTSDLMTHTALGWGYRERRVAQGAVVYVACEGEGGLAARVEAFRRHHELDEENSAPPFFLVTTRMNLVAERDRLISDIRAQIGEIEIVAIVIDTLNRSLQGSESSDEDMSAYVNAADSVRAAFACAVIVVHHCGINEQRPRGHTSLTGAVDAQIAVRKDESGLITATVEHMKDGPSGETVNSRLEVIEVGTDEDGDTITSCVVVPADDEASAPVSGGKKTPKLTSRQAIAKQAIMNFFADGLGQDAPRSKHIPPGHQVADRDGLKDALEASSVARDIKEPKRRREAIGRALESLQKHGVIGAYGDWVWLVK